MSYNKVMFPFGAVYAGYLAYNMYQLYAYQGKVHHTHMTIPQIAEPKIIKPVDPEVAKSFSNL